jgi:hypothetical protein
VAVVVVSAAAAFVAVGSAAAAFAAEALVLVAAMATTATAVDVSGATVGADISAHTDPGLIGGLVTRYQAEKSGASGNRRT